MGIFGFTTIKFCFGELLTNIGNIRTGKKDFILRKSKKIFTKSQITNKID